jgi:hypothetical protein
MGEMINLFREGGEGGGLQFIEEYRKEGGSSAIGEWTGGWVGGWVGCTVHGLWAGKRIAVDG